MEDNQFFNTNTEALRSQVDAYSLSNDGENCTLARKPDCGESEEHNSFIERIDDYDAFHPRSRVEEMVRRYGGVQNFKDACEQYMNQVGDEMCSKSEGLEECRDIEEHSGLADRNDDYDIFHPRSRVEEMVRRLKKQGIDIRNIDND